MNLKSKLAILRTDGARDTGLVLMSKGAQVVVGIGTQAILAWTLGPGGRGTYALCLIFINLLLVCAFPGLDSAATYYVSSKKQTLSETIAGSLLLGLLFSVLSIAVGLGVLNYFPSLFEGEDLYVFKLCLLAVPVSFLSMISMNLLIGLRQMQWFAGLTVLKVTSLFVMLLAFLVLQDGGVTWAVGSFAMSHVVVFLVSVWVFFSKLDAKLVWPRLESMKELMSYGMRYYVGKIGYILNNQMSTLVLAMISSREMVGLFSIAANLTGRIEDLTHAVNTTLVPRIAGASDGRVDLVAQCSRLAVIGCGTLLLVISCFAAPIVETIFSPKFRDSIPLVQVLCFGMVFRTSFRFFGTYLTCTNRPGRVSIAVISGVIVNVTLVLVLFPRIGLVGSAIASCCGYILTASILHFNFLRCSGVRFSDVWIHWSKAKTKESSPLAEGAAQAV